MSKASLSVLTAVALLAAVTVLIACTSRPGSATNEPTSTATPEFPLTSRDLDCVPNQARLSSVTGAEIRQIDFSPTGVQQGRYPNPLSTPTAAPGRTVTTAYANGAGGDTDCFLLGSIGNLFVGGTHDVEEPMLLRFTVAIPSGLTLLDHDHAPSLVDSTLLIEFEIFDRSSEGRRSGNYGLKFTSDTPGAYEVGVNAEWFTLASMTPYADQSWSGQRTFIFYAVTG